MPDRQITLIKDKNGFEFFCIQFPYDKALIEFIKKIPTRKFHAPSASWRIRADHVTAKYVEAFARKLNFDLDMCSKKYIERMVHPQFEITLPTLKRELREFQKEGVSYAVKYERCFIADEMGLGKSGQSIAAVETTNSYPCLIICPASLKLNWKKEIAFWLDKNIKVIDGFIKPTYEIIHDMKVLTGYETPDYDADFIIINYDILYREKKSAISAANPKDIVIPDHKDLLKTMNFKSIIVDECQLISNFKSLRTKAVKEISRKIRYRYALSGTPILNRPKELIAQLDFLDRLDTFGGFWTFAKRYCAAFEGDFGWDFSGASNLDELYLNMRKTCFIRRKKEDVLSELPAKQRIMIPVELSNAKEYETASKNFRKWMQMTSMNETEFYEELKKIPLLTDSQRRVVASAKATKKLNKTLSAEAIVKIEKLKQITARGKLEKVYEFINNFLMYDEKLLIFAKHQEIYKKLIDKYRDVSVHIVGGMTSKQKDAAEEEFQTNPEVKLLIGALDAAGIGLNLTASSTVVFVELGWTSAIHDQAEDRVHRIGQKDFVKCYYFYAEKTIDEQILELIESKRAIAANIEDGVTIPSDSAVDDDITELLSKFI